MTPDTLLLDLDGVMADCIGGISALLRKEPDWSRSGDLGQAFGMHPDLIWEKVSSCSPTFWEGLSPLPGMISLLALAKKFERRGGRWAVCSTPRPDPRSAAGKITWMQQYIVPGFRDYMLTPVKHLSARPGTLLVDDHPSNCERFRAAGGQSLLWPAPYNERHHVLIPEALKELEVLLQPPQ